MGPHDCDAHALLHVGLSRTAWLLRKKLMMTVSFTRFAIVNQ
jgi:hypothetical protein